MNHHALISLESATATAFCSKHSQPFRLFDETCNHMVCRGCINRSHKRHKLSSFADAASKCRQEMPELATKVNARSEEIKTAEAQVKQAMLDMENSRKKQKAQIHSLFKEVGFPWFYRPCQPIIIFLIARLKEKSIPSPPLPHTHTHTHKHPNTFPWVPTVFSRMLHFSIVKSGLY